LKEANMNKAKILRSDKCEKVEADWGCITWFANGKLGNSEDMTVGKCVIKPGCENPHHSHPNCSETLVVLQGRISHAIEGGKEVELDEGDVITLPANMPHKARNIGKENAVLLIAFSSADRRTEGE
jgi:quercetin dioxygenase-like cupin family protein